MSLETSRPAAPTGPYATLLAEYRGMANGPRRARYRNAHWQQLTAALQEERIKAKPWRAGGIVFGRNSGTAGLSETSPRINPPKSNP